MIIKTDLNEIKSIAELKEDENWEFRSFLKGFDRKKIDIIERKLYKDKSSKIDCKTCGNCCIEVLPVLNQKDIKRLSKGLDLSIHNFKDRYLIEEENSEGFTFNKKPCPFLDNNMCSQYQYRPDGRIYGIELLNANEQLQITKGGRSTLTDESTGKTVRFPISTE